MLEVWKQICLGIRTATRSGTGGRMRGGRQPICGKLVDDAIGKMNELVGFNDRNMFGTIGSLECPKAEYLQEEIEDEIKDGVEEQTDGWLGDHNGANIFRL